MIGEHIFQQNCAAELMSKSAQACSEFTLGKLDNAHEFTCNLVPSFDPFDVDKLFDVCAVQRASILLFFQKFGNFHTKSIQPLCCL